MKTVLRLSTTAVFLLFSLALWAQTTFCAQLIEVSNTATEFVVSVQLQGSTNFNLGSSNLVVEFDESLLSNPSLRVNNIPGPPFYQPVTVTNPTSNTFSVNIELGFQGFGTPIAGSPGFTQAVQVAFTKVTSGTPSGDMTWRYTGGTTGTVVFLDDEATQMFATDPACLVGLTSVPLPVELLSFQAEKSDKHSFITWETASEVNNAGFWLEHSLDGRSWNKLSWIDGKGEATKYSYLHESPIPGSHYYRLRQVDHDGTEDFSDIRTLTFDGAATMARLAVWPNPTTQVLHSNVAEATSAVLTDQLGREVWSGVLQPNAALEVSSFAEGIYYLKVGDEVVKVLVGR